MSKWISIRDLRQCKLIAITKIEYETILNVTCCVKCTVRVKPKYDNCSLLFDTGCPLNSEMQVLNRRDKYYNDYYGENIFGDEYRLNGDRKITHANVNVLYTHLNEKNVLRQNV